MTDNKKKEVKVKKALYWKNSIDLIFRIRTKKG